MAEVVGVLVALGVIALAAVGSMVLIALVAVVTMWAMANA